jgi:hypothetical protein
VVEWEGVGMATASVDRRWYLRYTYANVVEMSRGRFQRLLNVALDTAVAMTTISSYDRPWIKPKLATLSTHRTLSIPTLKSDYEKWHVE